MATTKIKISQLPTVASLVGLWVMGTINGSNKSYRVSIDQLKGNKGDDGKKIILEMGDEALRYQYEGDAEWTVLITKAAIMQPATDAATAANAVIARANEVFENPPRVDGSTQTWWLYNYDLHRYVDSTLPTSGHAPKVGDNGNFWNWDDETQSYVDSGIVAEAGFDPSNVPVTFSEIESTSNIASGQTVAQLFGLIQHWLGRLGSLAFKGVADWDNDVENKPDISTMISDALSPVQEEVSENTAHRQTTGNPHGLTPSGLGVYTKQEIDDLYAALQNASYKTLGYGAQNDPSTYTDPVPQIKSGTLWVQLSTSGEAPIYSPNDIPMPWTNVKVWDGSAWQDSDPYTANTLDTFQDLDHKDEQGNYITWFYVGGTWNRMAATVDLSAYRTSAAQDAIDEGKVDTARTIAGIALSSDITAAALLSALGLTNDFNNEYKDYIDFMTGANAATSLASLPVTKQTIYATLSASQSALSLAAPLPTGRTIQIFCRNATSSAITVAVPSAAPYTNMGDASYSIPTGGWIEIHITAYADGLYNIRVGEQG
jgi:hypothetical protein